LAEDDSTTMEKIDELGLFWLSGHEDDALTGRLTFDPETDGTRLSLVGTFDGLDEENDSELRILGWINNDRVTLDRCFRTSNKERSPGPAGSGFYANQLFVGCHLHDEAAFDSVAIKIDHLSAWVGRTGISENSDGSDHTISYEHPQEESARFSRGELSMGFGWTRGGSSLESATITSKPFLKLRYDSRQPFSRIRSDMGHLTSLVSICVGTPVILDDVELYRSDITVTMMSGPSEIPQPITYLAVHLNYQPPSARKLRHQHEVHLSYDDLGGVPTAGAWLDKAGTFQRALSSLMSIARTKSMFAENKFMNVTYAAEALHREILGRGEQMESAVFDSLLRKYLEQTPPEHHNWLVGRLGHANEPSLVKRLNDLARHVGPAARNLLGKRERWAQTISLIRNDLTHLGTAEKGPGGTCLYYLTESVFALVKMFLLLETGVPRELLERKVAESELVHYRERIADSIDQARAYLRATGSLASPARGN
jgi:hypothetical protein